MRFFFPRYVTFFSCGCTVQESLMKISETVLHQHNGLKVMGTYYTGTQEIVLRSRTGDYLHYNSFMPVVNIDVRDAEGKTKVSVSFELPKSTRLIMKAFSVLALLFEIGLIILFIMNQLSTPVILCLPLGMMIFSYTLCTVGLYFSSKNVLRVLLETLTCEGGKGDKGTVLLSPDESPIQRPIE